MFTWATFLSWRFSCILNEEYMNFLHICDSSFYVNFTFTLLSNFSLSFSEEFGMFTKFLELESSSFYDLLCPLLSCYIKKTASMSYILDLCWPCKSYFSFKWTVRKIVLYIINTMRWGCPREHIDSKIRL